MNGRMVHATSVSRQFDVTINVNEMINSTIV